jgi:hypothetical protein
VAPWCDAHLPVYAPPRRSKDSRPRMTSPFMPPQRRIRTSAAQTVQRARRKPVSADLRAAFRARFRIATRNRLRHQRLIYQKAAWWSQRPSSGCTVALCPPRRPTIRDVPACRPTAHKTPHQAANSATWQKVSAPGRLFATARRQRHQAAHTHHVSAARGWGSERRRHRRP